MNNPFANPNGTSIANGSQCEDVIVDGGKNVATVPATTAVAVKQGPGRLCRVLVSASGTAATPIYDADGQVGRTSGVLIGYVPANATVGSIYSFNMPCAIGIYVPATANGSGLTVSFN